MNRLPVVAGTFYPGIKAQWERLVHQYLDTEHPQEPALLAMIPHAGYIYSGAIAGETLASVLLPETVLLLGPNHTGLGAPLSLWPSGCWHLPGAHLDVDEALARAVLEGVAGVQADHLAHLQEHSLEVILPFLWAKNPAVKIVPLAVSEPRLDNLLAVARDLSNVLRKWKAPVLILVSSDMSHFLPADEAKARDSLALRAVLDLDPRALFETVRSKNISMCGVLPMTMGLVTAIELGATKARLARYGNSGEQSGDFAKVVGYAGVVVT
jgi:MEMO1 family protein